MVKTIKKKIILASESPRRQELLKHIFDNFEIRPSNTDEALSEAISPIDAVMFLAHQKAEGVAQENDGIIIGADTVVVLGDAILGKPRDESCAKEMLLKLSDKTHKVLTGICVFDTYTGKMSCSYSCTDVTFDRITPQEADEYLLQNESLDKAGGYAIQGKGSKFVKSINGCYYNVVGLPINLLYEILKGFELGG